VRFIFLQRLGFKSFFLYKNRHFGISDVNCKEKKTGLKIFLKGGMPHACIVEAINSGDNIKAVKMLKKSKKRGG